MAVSSSMGHGWRGSVAEGRVQGHRRSDVCGITHLTLIIAFDTRLYSNDLEWDGESKRIIAVGDGREKCVLFLLSFPFHQPLSNHFFEFVNMFDERVEATAVLSYDTPL